MDGVVNAVQHGSVKVFRSVGCENHHEPCRLYTCTRREGDQKTDKSAFLLVVHKIAAAAVFPSPSSHSMFSPSYTIRSRLKPQNR